MHSSHANGTLMRGSNSPLGSREQPRGQSDYSTWKNRQLDSSSYSAPPTDRMDVEYASPPNVVNPGYVPAPYGGPQAPGYPPAPYQGQVPAPPYGQPYGYPPNPPAQYSPGPQPSADRYAGMPAPPPIATGYPQDAPFVHGSNYQSTGYPAPGPNRMTPMSMSSAPPSRTFSATAGAPGYGGDSEMFGYQAAGTAAAPLQFPTDPGYGRAGGAYTAATTVPPPRASSSDDLGSPAGTAPPRPGYGAPPDPQFDERQSPALPNAPTPTNGGTASIPPPSGPTPARRDADPRERDRDHRDHRARRAEPDREDRHAAERARHRHGHR